MSLPFSTPTFTTVMRGYDAAQVNELLNRVAAAQADPIRAAALAAELRSVRLDVVARGLKTKEVDRFLAQVAQTLAASGQATAAPAAHPAADPALPNLLSRPHGDRFGRKRLRNGYRVEEVDAYVERVYSTLSSTLTSHEVEAVQFRSGFGAYDVDAVDDWLDQVRGYLSARGR